MSLSIGAGITCRDYGRTFVLHPVGRVDNAQALRSASKPVVLLDRMGSNPIPGAKISTSCSLTNNYVEEPLFLRIHPFSDAFLKSFYDCLFGDKI